MLLKTHTGEVLSDMLLPIVMHISWVLLCHSCNYLWTLGYGGVGTTWLSVKIGAAVLGC